MAVTVVRPDGTLSGASNVTNTGAATAQAATSDASDATYFRKANALTGTYSIVLSTGTTTVSATQRVKAVRVRARCSTPTTAGKLDVTIGTREDFITQFHSALAIRGQYVAATDFTGTYWTATPAGNEWTQATIDALRIKVTEYKDTTDIGYVYALYADVDVANQPSVTVTAPTGTVTSTSSPALAWTYTDPDSDAQAFYQVKVFTAAQYGAAGFNAETSTATWDSGEVSSGDVDAQVGAFLVSGTYRAYVKAAKAVNGQPFWSAWAFSGFTVNLSVPTTPTLTGSWNSASGYATLTINGANPAGFASQYFQLERSDDGGTTYALIRNGDEVATDGNYDAIVLDYEAPRGVTARYRARSIGVNGAEYFPTAWSNIVQVLVTNDGTWWFKCAADPTLNTGSLKVDKVLPVQVTEPNVIFRPLGRTYPVVVTGLIGGADGSYTIYVTSAAQWDSVEALLRYQGTLLVQDPLPRQKYIRIVNRSWDETYAVGSARRTVRVDYVEVED